VLLLDIRAQLDMARVFGARTGISPLMTPQSFRGWLLLLHVD